MTLAMLALFAITLIPPFYFEQLRSFCVEDSGFRGGSALQINSSPGRPA
jgi:hypothetical protein